MGAENISIIPGTTSDSTVRLGPNGHSEGLDPGTYGFDTIVIEANQTLECESDDVGARGITLSAVDMTVAGHLSADGLGYSPVNNGPGVPGDDVSGAGHGGRGAGPAGGDTYGSLTEPITLGSAGLTTWSENGGGAIRLLLGGFLEIPLAAAN